MKKINYIIILTVSIFYQSCQVSLNNCTEGEGAKEERIIAFNEDITKIDIDEEIELVISEGDAQEIRVESFPNLINLLETETEVNGGQWKISFNGCTDTDGMKIFVRLNQLEELKIDGNALIRTEGVFENIEDLKIKVDGVANMNLALGEALESIDLDVDGSSFATLSGKTNSLKIQCDGEAMIDALDLISLKCDIDIDGAGEISVHVLEELTLDIEGAGNICLKGNPPQINQQIEGVGEILDCN